MEQEARKRTTPITIVAHVNLIIGHLPLFCVIVHLPVAISQDENSMCQGRRVREAFFVTVTTFSHSLALCLHDLCVTDAGLGSPRRAQRDTLDDASYRKERRAEDQVRILVALHEMPAGGVEKADVRATRR